MNSNYPDKETLRRYLLGRFDDQRELEESLSDQMFDDKELSEMVDSVEDEILEEYLDGILPPADTQAVEEYFLRPPGRQEKLQFARVLRQYFVAHSPAPAETTQQAQLLAKHSADRADVIHVPSYTRTALELAALVLLSVSCLVYINSVRSGLQSKIADNRENLKQLEARLEQERQRSAGLEDQIAAWHPPVATLILDDPRRSDPFRSLSSPQQQTVEIYPWTQRVKVDLLLGQGASSDLYDVALERAGQSIWSSTGMPLSHENHLIFEMPARGFSSGAYVLSVASHRPQDQFRLAESPRRYTFGARVTK